MVIWLRETIKCYVRSMLTTMYCLQLAENITYYASIMLDASKHLLYSKLCQHNRLLLNDHGDMQGQLYIYIFYYITTPPKIP